MSANACSAVGKCNDQKHIVECQSETFGLNWVEQCLGGFIVHWDVTRLNSLLLIFEFTSLKNITNNVKCFVLKCYAIISSMCGTYVFLKMYGWILQQCTHQLMRIPGNRLCTAKRQIKKNRPERDKHINKWCNECEKERNEKNKYKN